MRTEVRVELDHVCPCGVTSPAWVHGEGSIMQDDEEEAQRNAALLVRLARCPKCQSRDSKEIVRALLPAMFAALFVELVHLAAGYWNSLPGYFDSVYAYYTPRFVAVAVIAFIAYAARGTLRILSSDRHVSFIEERKSEQQGPYRSSP